MKLSIQIAIDRYADERMPPVPYGGNDARAIAAALEPHSVDKANNVLLLGETASKTAVESRIRRAMKTLRPGEHFVLFYSGRGFHCEGINYLTCYDSDLEDICETSIALDWLAKQFDASTANGVFFFDVSPVDWSALASLGVRSEAVPEDWDNRVVTDLFPNTTAPVRTGDPSPRRCVSFVSHSDHEVSHSSPILQSSIWAHHLAEAFAGKAPKALVHGTKLTGASLQKYLVASLPRTLIKTFADKPTQTPWSRVGAGSDFVILDLTDYLSRQSAALDPRSSPVKKLTLVSQRTMPIKGLSGYKKGFRLPELANSAAQEFVSKLARTEITDDVKVVFAELKKAFGFKRADMHLANEGDGTATIITPHFNYSITIALNSDDLSEVIWRRAVDAIKEPDPVLSDGFASVFAQLFDTVEFETPALLDLAAFIDRVEELDNPRITLDYDPEVSYCRLAVEGILGEVSVTQNSFSVVHRKPRAPLQLLQSFFEIQRVLVDKQNKELLAIEKTDAAGD